MKIKYIHASAPKLEKIYDTEKSLKNNPMIHISQNEWDKHELQSMENDKTTGKILHYEIMEES